MFFRAQAWGNVCRMQRTTLGPGSLFVAVLVLLPAAARADAVPDLPEPHCDEGYVVAHGHGGPYCTRPSCNTTSDCPDGLLCTPRRCLRAVRVPGCSGGAKEPPDPCAGIEDLGPCSSDVVCPEGAWCSAGTCLPPDEHAAYVAGLPAATEPEPEAATGPTASETETSDATEHTPPPVAPSGGGCCGSRGARASAAAALAPLVAALVLARRRR